MGTVREQLSTSLLVFALQRPIYFASLTFSLRKFIYFKCREALLGELGSASQQLTPEGTVPGPALGRTLMWISPLVQSLVSGGDVEFGVIPIFFVVIGHRSPQSFLSFACSFAHSFVHTLHAGTV